MDVAGFEEGAYTATVDITGGHRQQSLTVDVGLDGTGSAVVDGGLLYQADPGATVLATMEGVCSGATVPLTC